MHETLGGSMLQELLTGSTRRPYTTEWLEEVSSEIGSSRCEELGFYVIPDDFVLSVVVPVYNEQKTLETIVNRLREVPIRKQIILVDDCSSDQSMAVINRIAKQADSDTVIVTAFHEKNRGKGAALHTGLKHATGTVVIVHDSDLGYDPADYPRLLQPVIDGQADAISTLWCFVRDKSTD